MAAALVVSVAAQIGVNIANDVADAATGADSPRRVGPPRAVASGLLTPRQAWKGVAVSFAVAGVAGLYLIAIAGWAVAVMGIAVVAAALGYTSGPAYGYRALGEVSVFIFFGLVATVGSRFVHDRSAPSEAWVLGIVVGLLITAILVANNLRDIETDAASGKRTLAVVTGVTATKWLYASCLVVAFAVVAVAAAVGSIPAGSALGLVVAPALVPLIRMAFSGATGHGLIPLLVSTSRLQAAFGLAAAAGIAWIG